jgi:hypothetical protein
VTIDVHDDRVGFSSLASLEQPVGSGPPAPP